MRKKLMVYLIILLSIIGLTSFNNTTKEIDEKLIGDWKGFEKDAQIDGLEKHWIQHRSKDGSFFIIFTSLLVPLGNIIIPLTLIGVLAEL